MSAKEIRAHLCEVRAAPEGKGIRFGGYTAKFNVWSQDLGGFRERILPGAFAQTIEEDDIRCLLNHDSNHVLGRNLASTLQLFEDEVGLRFEVDAPDTGWARDLKISVERGDINQCSFTFVPVEEEWEWAAPGSGELDERALKRVKLMDVSIVTYPAYTDTEASVRSAQNVRDTARDAAREKAEKIRKNNIDMMRRKLALKEKEW